MSKLFQLLFEHKIMNELDFLIPIDNINCFAPQNVKGSMKNLSFVNFLVVYWFSAFWNQWYEINYAYWKVRILKLCNRKSYNAL